MFMLPRHSDHDTDNGQKHTNTVCCYRMEWMAAPRAVNPQSRIVNHRNARKGQSDATGLVVQISETDMLTAKRFANSVPCTHIHTVPDPMSRYPATIGEGSCHSR